MTEPPTTLRARLHDPAGPLLTRAVLPAIAAAAIAIDAYWCVADGALPGPGMFVGLALLSASPILRGRSRPQDVDLVLKPGRIRVVGAGALRQTLGARGIRAASTARTRSGVSLALVRRDRSTPLLLELASDDDARRVQDALGIGHAGFGKITWPTRVDRPVTIARAVAAVTWLALPLILALAPETRQALDRLDLHAIAKLTVIAGFFGAIIEAARTLRGTLTLAPAGLRVWGPVRAEYWYHQIRDARAHDGGVSLTLASGKTRLLPVDVASHLRGGLTRAELALVADQIRSAAQRARGGGAARSDAPSHLDALRRRGEEATAWLGRIDALAATMADGTVGYRGAAPAPAELWAALRDPDADVEVRAAAARVLVRVARAEGDDALPRVRAVAASVRVADEADAILSCAELSVEDAGRAMARAGR